MIDENGYNVYGKPGYTYFPRLLMIGFTPIPNGKQHFCYVVEVVSGNKSNLKLKFFEDKQLPYAEGVEFLSQVKVDINQLDIATRGRWKNLETTLVVLLNHYEKRIYT